MGKILVVDDTPFWRDIAADALRMNGYEVATAIDGLDGLATLRRDGADMVILDVEMPQMPGLAFLEQIRREDRWKRLPVLMLTGDMRKDHIIRARELGAAEYLLKSRFSLPEMLDRVRKRLAAGPEQARRGKPASVATAAGPTIAPMAPASPISLEKPSVSRQSESPIPRLMDRAACLLRAEQAMAGKTLSGIAMQVIASSASPRVDMSDLANLIARDSFLSARVLQAANSVSYTSNRGTVGTLPDAVRVIGCTTVRDLASAAGVFDAMPASETDGFNPLRCWQHSLAVAMLAGQLAREDDRAQGYLIGLCHDLGEVLFRSHFGDEYRQVLAAQKASGKPIAELEKLMLGLTHGDLADKILESLGLPDFVRRPIAAFHDAQDRHVPITDPLARLLRIADLCATGMLLTASQHSSVEPLTRTECKSVTGEEDPTMPDIMRFRNEIYALTAMYSRLGPAEEAKLLVPPFPPRGVPICLVRDAGFSNLDPVGAALESLAEVSVVDRMPTADVLRTFRGIVVLARGNSEPNMATKGLPPMLWLTRRVPTAQSSRPAKTATSHYPVELARLAEFISEV